MFLPLVVLLAILVYSELGSVSQAAVCVDDGDGGGCIY
jgi:hypothetical protein